MGWRIYLLGDVRLHYGEREITRFESRKVAQLLARVALQPARVHPREELAALLWPDADRTTGLERLRHVLSSLQRQIASPLSPPEPLLVVDRQSVRLNRPSAWCDATEFETAVRARRFPDAAELYKGDLMPGDYDDWVQDERERLAALYEQSTGVSHEPSGLGSTPPPVERVSTPARLTLPSYLTQFFGRDEERLQLRQLLQTRRLITLLGMGGCGKTRLAVEVAREADFAHTVWVSLADSVDPALVPQRLRAALGLSASGSPLEQVATVLADVPTLIVLDNLEQMTTSGAAEAVEELLTALPNVRCLVTSRALLHLPGEQAFPLTPLPWPGLGEDMPSSDISLNPSVALFVDRVRNSRPDFTVTDRNRQEIATLCRLLEGIPLALELVASRIRTLTLTEMCRQLQEGQRFIIAARPDAAQRKDPRHGSLRGAVAWSWRLLTPRQQDFLATLSVLRGRWDVEIARDISAAPDATALLEELEAVSLIQTYVEDVGQEERLRFSLGETIREFAWEQLPPVKRHRVHQTHTAHILRTADNPATIDQLLLGDITRLAGAVEDALTDGDTDDALRLSVGLRNAFIAAGATTQGLMFVQRALALPGGTRENRIKALVAGVDYALTDVNFPLAEEFVAQGLALAGDDATLLAAMRSAEAHLRYFHGDDAEVVRAIALDALAKAEVTDEKRVQANTHALLGMLASRTRQWEEAQQHYAQAEALAVAQGRASVVSQLRFKQAILASDSGDFARSEQLYQECLIVARRENDRETEVRILTNLAAILGQQRRWAEALPAIQDGLRVAFALGSEYLVHINLWNLAEPLAYTNRGEDALTVLTWAENLWLAKDGALSEEDKTYEERVKNQARVSLPARDTNQTSVADPEEQPSLRSIVSFALQL